MNHLSRLYEILQETTQEFRKGPEVTTKQVGIVEVTEVYAMPHVDHAPAGIEKVDVEFMVVGVDKALAEPLKGELRGIVEKLSDLAEGPSYIKIGFELGDQGAALRLFALGKVLGFWDVITPHTLGFEGERAAEMAGAGYVMISGYRKEHERA